MILNKIKRLIPIVAVIVGLSGCLKGNDVNLPATAGNILQLEYIDLANNGTTINAGLNYFSKGALTYPATDDVDTLNFIVDLVGPGTLSKDAAITIGADANALLDNYSNDSISYLAMPDSTFKIISSTATIKAGTRSASFAVVFYPSKFDPTKSFMLPITVTDAQGVAVSQNYGHLYLHVIGNPIAGNYTHEWIRFNNATETPPASYDNIFGDVLSPSSPTEVSFSSGTGVTYIVDFKNGNTGSTVDYNKLTNFTVKFDAASVTNAGITITSGPSIVKIDPANGIYKFRFTYNNSAGSPRVIYDYLTK